jgi:hypothetical protein
MFDDLGLPLKFTHDGAGTVKPVPFESLDLCASKFRRRPVVFLYRDPRDTAVSAYLQKHLRESGYAGSVSDFIRDPLYGIEKIVRYNLTWLERGRHLRAFMPITYETLRSETIVTVKKLVNFLGVHIPTEAIVEAVSNNTFEKMQAREANGLYVQYDDKLTPKDKNNPETYKVRRGKIGGYIDYLGNKDMDYCNAIMSRYAYFERAVYYCRPRLIWRLAQIMPRLRP